MNEDGIRIARLVIRWSKSIRKMDLIESNPPSVEGWLLAESMKPDANKRLAKYDSNDPRLYVNGYTESEWYRDRIDSVNQVLKIKAELSEVLGLTVEEFDHLIKQEE